MNINTLLYMTFRYFYSTISFQFSLVSYTHLNLTQSLKIRWFIEIDLSFIIFYITYL